LGVSRSLVEFGVQIYAVTGCETWLSSRIGTILIPCTVEPAFDCVGKLVLVTAELYSCAVYALEEALCSIIGNSSVEHLHPNRKARASVIPTKFGIQVGPKEGCSWTVTDAIRCVTGTLL